MDGFAKVLALVLDNEMRLRFWYSVYLFLLLIGRLVVYNCSDYSWSLLVDVGS